MTNFSSLFKYSENQDLKLHSLVEPLCQVINLNSSNAPDNENPALSFAGPPQQNDLTMADYTFFWDLADLKSACLTKESALAICQVMQTAILQRDPTYRGVAEKIFFKLLGKFLDEDV